MDDIRTDNNGATGGENISDSGCWLRTERGSGGWFSIESI